MAIKIITADVIGIRSYSFTGRDGAPVLMSDIYFTFEDSRTDGFACGRVSTTEKAIIRDGITIGSPVKVVFAEKRWQYVGVN